MPVKACLIEPDRRLCLQSCAAANIEADADDIQGMPVSAAQCDDSRGREEKAIEGSALRSSQLNEDELRKAEQQPDRDDVRARLPLNNHKRLACVPADADRKGQNRESIKAATEHQSPLRDCDREEFIRLVVKAGEDPAVTSTYTRDPLRGGARAVRQ